MRYRGGGIGHGYMREIENRFEDMRREQIGLEGAPRATQPSGDAANSVGEPPASVAEAMPSAGNASMADGDGDSDGDGDDRIEEEDPEKEWVDICPGEDYLDGGESEDIDDTDGDEIGQGTYGMGEY